MGGTVAKPLVPKPQTPYVPDMAKTRGRPSDYTRELAEKICERVATSTDSLEKICSDDDMPNRATVYRWLFKHAEFSDMYARAKEGQMELMAEECLQIADDGRNDIKIIEGRNGEDIEVTNHDVINRSRLRVDTRKWLMSKLAPRRYGEKAQLELDAQLSLNKLTEEELLAAAAPLIERMKDGNGE